MASPPRIDSCIACGREFVRPKYERAARYDLCPACDPRPRPPKFNEDAVLWEVEKATGDYRPVPWRQALREGQS
jgi:hypothetical protein